MTHALFPRFCGLCRAGLALALAALPSKTPASHADEVFMEGAGANSNTGMVYALSLLLSIWDVPGRCDTEISNVSSKHSRDFNARRLQNSHETAT